MKVEEKIALQLAMQAALAARKPTFLAYYPRALKLAVAFVLLLLLILPVVWIASTSAPHGADDHASPPVHEEAADAAQQPAQEAQAPAKPEPQAEASAEAPPLPEADEDGAAKTLPPETSPTFTQTRSGQPLSEAQKQAIAHNDAEAQNTQLPQAPDPAVTEQAGESYLPKIGADGRKPMRVYARPFDEMDPRPRVAIVMVDMGLSRIATDAALRRMPPNVAMAFDVQGAGTREWLARARHDGHETLISLPMEPLDYPRSDPGPNTLLTSLPNSDNLTRLFMAMKSGTGYIGVTSLTGSRFVTDAAKLQPILEEVKGRGLLILDTRSAPHSLIKDMAEKMDIPLAVSARTIDGNPSAYAIDAALADVEQRARMDGAVVIVASPLPTTLDRLEVWIQKISQRGLALAPLSAVVQ